MAVYLVHGNEFPSTIKRNLLIDWATISFSRNTVIPEVIYWYGWNGTVWNWTKSCERAVLEMNNTNFVHRPHCSKSCWCAVSETPCLRPSLYHPRSAPLVPARNLLQASKYWGIPCFVKQLDSYPGNSWLDGWLVRELFNDAIFITDVSVSIIGLTRWLCMLIWNGCGRGRSWTSCFKVLLRHSHLMWNGAQNSRDYRRLSKCASTLLPTGIVSGTCRPQFSWFFSISKQTK